MAGPIPDLRAPRAAFKMRRACLLKKASQLSILCGVDVALVVYASRADADGLGAADPDPVTWPSDPREVARILCRLDKAIPAGGGRQRRIACPEEAAVAESWNDEASLRAVAASLGSVIQNLVATVEPQTSPSEEPQNLGLASDIIPVHGPLHLPPHLPAAPSASVLVPFRDGRDDGLQMPLEWSAEDLILIARFLDSDIPGVGFIASPPRMSAFEDSLNPFLGDDEESLAELARITNQ